ncbi:MAG: V-type ATP synthase subunit E [Nitrososphaerales archaeon]
MSSRESFENVVGKVARDAKAEILSSLEEAYKDALEIVEYEGREAAVKAAEIPQSKDRQAGTLRRRIIGGAELEARNRSLQLVEETVNRVFEGSLKRLNDLSSVKGYDKSLKRLLEEGVDAIGGDEFLIHTNSNDQDMLKKISREVETSRKVKIKLSSKPLDCRGGVQVMNSDGSVIYDNTVEARLERLKPLLRKQISDMLTK